MTADFDRLDRILDVVNATKLADKVGVHRNTLLKFKRTGDIKLSTAKRVLEYFDASYTDNKTENSRG